MPKSIRVGNNFNSNNMKTLIASIAKILLVLVYQPSKEKKDPLFFSLIESKRVFLVIWMIFTSVLINAQNKSGDLLWSKHTGRSN